MIFDRSKPYNQLAPLPPIDLLETREVLKKAIQAHTALAELKHVGSLLPNQSVLIQTLGLQEAKLSSEIENIVTTDDDLYRAYSEHDPQLTAGTKEVLNYPTALWHGFSALKDKKRLMTPALFEEICQILKGNTSGVRKVNGTKLTNAAGETIYTPPQGESLIREKLDQLVNFIYTHEELDPLVKLALIHYQFEAIHPFHDGNGRTGRIINILYLVQCGLLDLPILYLSRYFLQNRLAYYQGFTRVTEEGKWIEWVSLMLDAVIHTAKGTQQRIFAIHELMQTTSRRVKALLPRMYSKDLIEIIFQRPYCKIRFIEEAGIAHRDTASNYLKKLEELSILRGVKAGREKYYMNDAFIELLAK